MKPTPIESLVLHCLRYEFEASDQARTQDVVSRVDAADWRAAQPILQGHGLLPICHHMLARAGCTSVPGDAVAAVRHEYHLCTLGSMVQETVLREVLDCLADSGVRVIVLKGLYLAGKVYSAPQIRAASDIDLLVLPRDVERAATELLRLGYDERPSHARAFRKCGRFPVEIDLQYRLVGDKARFRQPTAIDIDAIFRRARPSRLVRAETLEMLPEHLLAYLCAHVVQHKFSRLIWLRDLREVTERFKGILDWRYFTELVSEWRLRTHAYLSLGLARRLAHAEVPEDVLDRMRPRYPTARALELALAGSTIVAPEPGAQWLLDHTVPLLGDKRGYRVWAAATLPFHAYAPAGVRRMVRDIEKKIKRPRERRERALDGHERRAARQAATDTAAGAQTAGRHVAGG